MFIIFFLRIVFCTDQNVEKEENMGFVWLGEEQFSEEQLFLLWVFCYVGWNCISAVLDETESVLGHMVYIYTGRCIL